MPPTLRSGTWLNPTTLPDLQRTSAEGPSFGVFLPASTPAPHVQRLGAAMKKALTDPAFAQVMEIRGVEPRWSSPEALATRLEADTRRWGPIVKLLNFSADS